MRLIKITFIALSFIFAGSYAQAQGGFFIGLEGDYLINSIMYQNNLGQLRLDYEKPEFQIAYGAHIGYKFNHRHSLKLGVFSYGGGQSYEDGFSFGRLNKTIVTDHIGIPLTYRLTTGKEDNDRHGFKFYIEAGPMLSFLTSGSISYAHNGAPTDFFTYHTIGGRNKNTQFIQDQNLTEAEQHDAKTFYNDTDILASGGLGIQYYITEDIVVSLGVTGGISLMDVNKELWRVNNADGEYLPARFDYAGVNLSLSYIF